MPEFDIDIAIEDERWHEALPDLSYLAESALFKTLEFTGLSPAYVEISLVFADDDFVQDLNARYRAKDKPTNVLSFPQMEPEEFSQKPPAQLMLGDVVMAYETIIREAEEQEKPMRAHTLHMLVHGILHLLGHDHETEDEATRMESLEIRILKTFGIDNPYENDSMNP